jgi:biotin transporter BioY
MGFGGAALKFGSTALYALEFCCAAIILGIYSYFLSVEADRDVNIPVWQQAVTGLAGAVVLYTIFAVLLTCFLGGKVRSSSTYYHVAHTNST